MPDWSVHDCISQSKHKKVVTNIFRVANFYKGIIILFAIFLLWTVISFGSQVWTSLLFIPQLRCEFLTGRTTISHFIVKNKGAQFYLIQGSLYRQYLILNWKQHTAVKAVDYALEYIKIYSARVSIKAAKGYLKSVEEEVIWRRARFVALYSVFKTRKNCLLF